ncbi:MULTISPECIES: ABC transporter ATP-binding protein [unclassified Desulfurobacterium]|uniref:ABC transporter ATP-binding protein n=1 Tax=unclassified Desulfurobacterium TaxID=2639089 RepID=UPI001E62538A|nr:MULTISPECIES: ABC transporter ATP-binding protein [unclassified Desulfurobacterium]
MKNVRYKNILRQITFSVKEGNITGIIGKNGSGKTTLLKAITGFLNYQGKIVLNGKEVKKLPLTSRIKQINLLPQEFPQSLLTVEEILRITSHLTYTCEKKIYEAMDKYHLQNLKKQPLLTLSGGEKVRLFLARLEVIDPKVVLLDEPSAFLDISVLKLLKEFVLKMKELQKIVIIVSNDLNFILNTADSIVGIKEGRTAEHSENLEQFLSYLYDCNINIKKVDSKNQIVI